MKKELETPYYLIDRDKLDSGIKEMKDAATIMFPGGYIIGYSYKTNSLPWIIKYFRDNGCYAEVVSDDEYNLGKHIGVESNKFIYNGIIKNKETFLEALKNGCIVNVDSKREIEWLKELGTVDSEINLGIRVNFDIEKECPGESQCGSEGGRFGFCYENGELEEAITIIEKNGFNIRGLHMHCSSKTRSLNIYKGVSKYAGIISQRYGLDLKYIDIGGGFFGGLRDKPHFCEYFKIVADELSQYFDLKRIKVIVEPGMSLIGSHISYTVKVIDVKDTEFNRFVIIDGSRTNIDPLMSKRRYYYMLNTKRDNTFSKQVICGFTCMEHDRLMVLENEKELSIGDEIVFDKVGAYTMCLTPLFIKYFPSVFVKEKDSIIQVREKWNEFDYCSKGEIK